MLGVLPVLLALLAAMTQVAPPLLVWAVAFAVWVPSSSLALWARLRARTGDPTPVVLASGVIMDRRPFTAMLWSGAMDRAVGNDEAQ